MLEKNFTSTNTHNFRLPLVRQSSSCESEKNCRVHLLFSFRSSSVRGLLLYCLPLNTPTRKNRTGSDLAKEEDTIPCGLLSQRTLSKQRAELWIIGLSRSKRHRISRNWKCLQNDCSKQKWQADIFLFQDATAPSGPGPPRYQGFTITLRRTPLDEWSARRRGHYWIRTRNPSKGAYANRHLEPRGHWDRHSVIHSRGNSLASELGFVSSASRQETTNKSWQYK